VDSTGQTIDFLLTAKRDTAAPRSESNRHQADNTPLKIPSCQ
jgi:hypothetical protein